MRDKLEDQIRRGERAAQLLADPLIVEAKEHIEAELWRVFRSLQPSAMDDLVQVKSMQYMHEKYFALLAKVLRDGKVAALELERQKKSLKQRIFG